MVHTDTTYWLYRVMCRPRLWATVAEQIALESRDGGIDHTLYGVWRSQIGRPRDELTVITAAPDGGTGIALPALQNVRGVEAHEMRPTLRPAETTAPRRQGNYAFRHFSTPRQHYDEFLDLCAGAWPGFESSYDSQVIGLWRFDGSDADMIDTLLLTRRPDLAMWERSKIPQGDEETEVRRKLSRRYDLCESTVVYTSTLLTAQDQSDTVRWT